MKPDRSILDTSFRYVPSVSTSVADTWRRFGWRPATEAEGKPPRPGASAATLVVDHSRRLDRAA
jgi:hypothetical protein